MREARKTLAVAGAALIAGCGGGTPSNLVTLTPTPGVGITSVMECLGQEATNAGYKIVRADREGGYMLAERRDRDPNIVQPREYAGGDRIEVNGVKQDRAIRAVTLKPSSFIMEWLANGANEKQVATSARVKGDVAAFTEKCKL